MIDSLSREISSDSLDWPLVLALARHTAEPAVTIIMSIEQPVAAHPETVPRLRSLVGRALKAVRSTWSEEAARSISHQVGSPDLQLEPRGETAQGLALLVTSDDGRLLQLPFAVEDQIVVDRTFATRQLFAGLARNPRYRVLVLDGHRARLYEGRAHHLMELEAHGFPLEIDPPHEWDTPQGDYPIHEEAEKEEHRFVYRLVDEALGIASRNEQLPVVLTAAERELVRFKRVTKHAELLVGQLPGNYAHVEPAELAASVRPVLEAHLEAGRARLVADLRESVGANRAVVGLEAVRAAADRGRGHKLVVEEGFTCPRQPVEQAGPIDDIVDDVIETVLLAGGNAEFVADGMLEDEGRIGLFVRY